VWSNYRITGRMWPATAVSVARGIIQEKPSNLKYVEKRVSSGVARGGRETWAPGGTFWGAALF